MNCFRKCRIELKTFEGINYFRRIAYVHTLFCWPNKSLWNFRIPKLNIKIKKIKFLENDSDD